ncbi:MAG: efflux RND transporter periplasmic adaptor subunit [Thauera sp.]|jgi:HlyD family secretion protein|nr:efflux RND transporter periplasmic adaptor subunit [Thauera sp.]
MESALNTSLPPTLPRRRRWPLLLAFALAAVAAAGATLLLRPPTVDVLLTPAQTMRQTVVVSGRVRTPERIELAAQVSGRVEQVLVREGDQLQAGQTVLRLDAREWQAQTQQAAAALAQAEAQLRQLRELGLPLAEHNVRQAEANLLQAERQHERALELLARGFYSQAQIDETLRTVEVNRSLLAAARTQRNSQRADGSDSAIARSLVEQARATLQLAETRLAHTAITAPLAASVLTRSVEVGDTVQTGQALLVLAPHAATELSAHVDEKNLAFLALDQPALASADAYPEQQFAARLSYIAPSVDPVRGSVEIRLQVAEPPPYLRHEMTVSIDIETARHERLPTLPLTAVVDAGSPRPWVMVVRDGHALRQDIEPGTRSSGQIEVRSGIAEAEAVLLEPTAVAPGSRVRVRPQVRPE